METIEISYPLESVKKLILVNFIIVGKTKTQIVEKIEININTLTNVRNIIADYLQLPSDCFKLYYKEVELTDDTALTIRADLKEGDSFLVCFKSNDETQFKRSPNRSETWNDAKNYIPFKVNKPIVLSALGFFRNYDNSAALYDFSLYEIQKGQKTLVSMVTNLKVMPSDADSWMVKKVQITPIILKPGVKYGAYIIHKIEGMRTYYTYSNPVEQTVNGVTFKFLDDTQPDYKVSSTSGHLPYIYFKLHNPYEE